MKLDEIMGAPAGGSGGFPDAEATTGYYDPAADAPTRRNLGDTRRPALMPAEGGGPGGGPMSF